MTSYFHVTARFLNPRFHGRGDGGEPEWPPSPLRLYQALVAAASARWHLPNDLDQADRALNILESRPAPVIVAPGIRIGEKYRLYVPDNAMDLVAGDWVRGRGASIASYRTEKNVQPVHLLEGDAVHYLWQLPKSDAQFLQCLEALSTIAVSVTHLGWGVDIVAADASVIDQVHMDQLPGHRWRPTPGGANVLRVPKAGTLEALRHRHQAFLDRLPTPDSFKPVPPLTTFDVVSYHRATDPLPRPFAAFSLLKPDGEGFQPFDAVRYATVVAGMVRHALARAAEEQQPFGWGQADVTSIIHGHNPDGGQARLTADAKRFAYLPLPSIEKRGAEGPPRHVGMIRRVIITGRPGMGPEIDWVRRALSGLELIDEQTGEVKALLSLIPSSDSNVRRYIGPSSTWTTVTPVIIPGFDDHRVDKIERLIRKSLLHAGLPPEVVKSAELDWRGVGYMPGLDLASRYRRPRNASEAPVRHVKVRFVAPDGGPLSLQGPLSLGSGRYRGLGLFAACPDGEMPH
ncbi:MAG: type I-U CRISPR-associated protein Cas5/Cas6 [Phycisphaeraceae bacterium]|nr:type I-U CRISPR-associated protein Cas5/Cas6 [Phycisphaeraceae bacterium]